MSLFSWSDDTRSSGSSRASLVAEPDRDRVYLPDPFGRLGRGRWGRRNDPFGRLPSGGETGRPLSDIAGDPFVLSAAVGGKGANANHPTDVAKVETMLGKTGHLDLGAAGGPTGYYGARLKQGVERFQKEKGLTVDGRLEPDGETIRALRDTLADRGRQPNGTAKPGRTASEQVGRIVDGLQAMDRAGVDWRRPPMASPGTADPVGYPQTGGRPAVGPDGGRDGRGPRPGETETAFLQSLPGVLEAVPWLLGALGAGATGKQPYDQYGKTRPSGDATPSGEGTAESRPVLMPEMMLKLYGTGGLANLGKALLDRSAGGDRDAGGRQAFDALDLQLPNHTEFPSEPSDLPRLPGLEAAPAETSSHEGRPATPAEPFVETLPDQSGEFEGFNVQEDVVDVDLEGGKPPHVSTQKALSRMQPHERDVISRHVLNGGHQIRGGRKLIIVEQKRSFEEKGENDLESFVRELGGDPGRITDEGKGQVKVYHDEEAGYTVKLRPFSSERSGGFPTLEFEIKRPGQRGELEAKLRYLEK